MTAKLLAEVDDAPSLDEGLQRALRQLVRMARASAGALVFRPGHGEPIVVTAGRGGTPSLQLELRQRVAETTKRAAARRGRAPLRWIALGPPGRPVAEAALLGSSARLLRKGRAASIR